MMCDGTRLGCIALCATCKSAIQLRRLDYFDERGSRVEVDSWEHFHTPKPFHIATPCAEVGAYYTPASGG